MKINNETDDSSNINILKKKFPPGLKGGKESVEYSNLSNIASEKQSTQGMHDQEREQLERAISNSKAQNYRKNFEEKRD